jgi:hypothetical protein
MTGHKAKIKAVIQPWWQKVLEHVESYPSVQLICHTFMVIVFCITAIFLSFAINDWKESNVKVEIKQAEMQKEVEIAKITAESKKAEFEARRQEAIAAQNPYAVAARERKEQKVTLNINAVGYEIGKSDGQTEINLQSVKVNGRKYDHSQRNLLTLAYHIGMEVGFPETIQSILLQETLAGKLGNRIGDTVLPTLKRSYGVMQVKAGTARQVLRLNPDLRKRYFPQFKSEKKIRDEEIIIQLIQDDVFTIKVAALYFSHQRKYATSWSQAVVSYNQGLGRARQIENPKEHKYYRKVVQRLVKEVRPFNKSVGLSIPTK